MTGWACSRNELVADFSHLALIPHVAFRSSPPPHKERAAEKGQNTKTYLGIYVERHEVAPDGLLLLAHALEDPAQRKVRIRIVRRLVLEQQEVLERLVEPAEPLQGLGAAEPGLRVAWRELAGAAVGGEGGLALALLVEDDADVGEEDGVVRVDVGGEAVVLLGPGELAVLLVHAAQPVPPVVVAGIGADGLAVRQARLVILLVRDVLVTLQRVAVRKVRAQLRGALEASNGLVVLALQREGVAECAPGLRGEAVKVDELVREEGQVVVLLEVPL